MGKKLNLGDKGNSSSDFLKIVAVCSIAADVISHGVKLIANKKTVKNVSNLGRKSAENFKKIK